MRITPDPVNPQGKIDPKAFTSPAEVTDAGALQLVVQDAVSTETWIQQNYWALRWREADILYQAPLGVMTWEQTQVPRSNVNPFVVGATVNAIHPKIMNGLFYENPPFVIRPRPNQQQSTIRAVSETLSTQLEQMKARQEMSWGIHATLLFGTGIWKWGFKSYTVQRPKYVRSAPQLQVPDPMGKPQQIDTVDSDSFTKTIEEVPVNTPTFEYRDSRFVLVDPGCRVPDIRKAKFVIDRMYLTYRDLIRLKDETYFDATGDDGNGGKGVLKNRYDLPDEATIRSWFEEPQEMAQQPGQTETQTAQGSTQVHHATPRFKKTTADPLDEPLEVLERWDNDKVITALQRVKIIRNEGNEFGVIPFLSCNWWDIPDAFWGLGLGRVIGVEQRVQAGIINACLDLASLIVNPMFVRSRGANIQDQQIRQRIGGIVTVDGPVKEALTLLQQPTIPAEVVGQLQLSEHRVEKTSGASDQMTMGSAPMGKSGGQMGRSGTGAAGMIQATMDRLSGFAETFVTQVYQPLLYAMHQMNKDKLPMSAVRTMLGEKLGADFQFDPSDFLNMPVDFEVLAGSHLAAKSQMAQSLFMMIQLFESKPLMDQLSQISKQVVDVEELFHMVHDISGWKNYYSIIKPMTDEQIKAQQQQNPALQKIQGQMTVNNQKFQQDQALIDQENEARVVRDMLRHIVEKSSDANEGGSAPTQ